MIHDERIARGERIIKEVKAIIEQGRDLLKRLNNGK